MTGLYAYSASGNAVYLSNQSDFNSVAGSTFAAANAGSASLWLNQADSNTVTGSFLRNSGGYYALYLQTSADYNVLTQSTFTVGSGGSAWGAVLVGGASWNSFDGCYFQSAGTKSALYLHSASNNTTITQSTAANASAADGALVVLSDSNTVDGSFFVNAAGPGI